MPSNAQTKWKGERIASLMILQNLCVRECKTSALTAAGNECLESFVVHLCGHFQGFCRDLYTECTQLCVAAAPEGLQAAIQAQFITSLRLDTGNPTEKNISVDFDRFGTLIEIQAAVGNRSHLLSDLKNVIHWRNHIVHRNFGPHPHKGPKVLTIKLLQKWKSSCDELVDALDGRMLEVMGSLLGRNPW